MSGDARSAAAGEQIGRAELREAALGGVRWIAVARIVAECSQMAAMVVLARLVSPAQFGHAAIALIVQALAVAITSAGFGTALVQRKELRREHVAAAQALVLAVGACLAAVTAAAAPVVVEPTLGAETARLVQLASVIFLILPLGVVSRALLQRRLEFRKIGFAEIAFSGVGAVASVALALAGLNGEALILGAVCANLALYGSLLAFAPPALPRLHWREIREIAAFGGPTSLSSIARSGLRNVDYAILGAVAGPAAVGFYWRAFQLGVEYQRKISGIMTQIALPLYARAAGVEDMRAVRNRIARSNATVIFPLLALLMVIAPELVPWVFGSRWAPAVVPTQILAGAGMCAAVLSGFGALVLAVGRPKALLAWDIASLAVYAAGAYLAAPHGVTALCVAVTAVFLAQLLTAHLFLLRPLLGIPVRQAFYDVLPALAGSTALVVAAAPVFALLQAAGAPPLPTMAAAAAIGLAAYMLLLRLAFGAAWRDLVLLFGRVAPLGRIRGRLARRTVATEAASSH